MELDSPLGAFLCLIVLAILVAIPHHRPTFYVSLVLLVSVISGTGWFQTTEYYENKNNLCWELYGYGSNAINETDKLQMKEQMKINNCFWYISSEL